MKLKIHAVVEDETFDLPLGLEVTLLNLASGQLEVREATEKKNIIVRLEDYKVTFGLDYEMFIIGYYRAGGERFKKLTLTLK
jgi:hypothetical protein